MRSEGVSVPRFDGCQPASNKSSFAKRHTPSEGTKAELELRRALWKTGLRYRVNVPNLLGRPDIVFRRARVAVFCDGDFFHGRHWHELRPKLERRANPSYWIRKIEYNRSRDRDVTAALAREGWRVLRFWETDIRSDVDAVVERIRLALDEHTQ